MGFFLRHWVYQVISIRIVGFCYLFFYIICSVIKASLLYFSIIALLKNMMMISEKLHYVFKKHNHAF